MNSEISRLGWRWPQRWLEAGLALLFPPRCVGCGRVGEFWCSDCTRSLKRLTGRLCPQCGFTLRSHSQCVACASSPIPIIVRSFAWYDGPLSRAVVHMKYRPNKKVAAMMAGWLVELYSRETWDVALIMPVPLSKVRLLQRGFNQATLISKHFAQILDLPYDEKALTREHDTKSQVGLDATARLRNVRGAFRGSPKYIQGQRVLVVDDLYTTGATMSACAESLLDAGASAVYGLTVGRARGKV